MLKIGVSSCFMPPDPKRGVFKAKTLLYMEQSMAHWIQGPDAFPFKAMPWLIPTLRKNSAIQLQDYLAELDGLVLHGGADVSPQSYGEEPLKPEWGGDAPRDAYEIELFHAFLQAGKPILGVCRGAQLMNVALGGTLYQDIPSQIKTSCLHRDPDIYDLNCHPIQLEADSLLLNIYPNNLSVPLSVTAIHHQAIQKLGRDLVVEARTISDGVVEAIRMKSQAFVLGVQWHPEFHDSKRQGKDILPSAPLLRSFLEAAERWKQEKRKATYET
ncbi:MAG: gamma-glutamyl-gamma-aminobutyrate hydrolase family protein [Bdellovibrionia bacterium]